MTKDEYTKTLKKWEYDNAQAAEDNGYGSGYSDALQEAFSLAEKLDESKKVVIPEFVADWIEKYDKCLIEYPAFIVHYVVEDCGLSAQDDWLDSRDNQKLLLNAIANGYEVEKEKKYRVKLPGMIGDNGQQYLSRSMDDKLFACAFRDYLEQEFTKEELEKFPDWIQQLEFEEVEDD